MKEGSNEFVLGIDVRAIPGRFFDTLRESVLVFLW